MSPAIYNLVLADTLIGLRSLFKHVQSPIEAPGKRDYGDVDVFVCEQLTTGTDYCVSPAALMTALNGIAVVTSSAKNTLHVAVEWPSDLTIEDSHQNPHFAQIDVTIFLDHDQFEWDLFHHAHGDLWSILGGVIRPYGLTVSRIPCWFHHIIAKISEVNNHGLNIRIPEIEKLDKKKSMIRLTKRPHEALKFLGYDEAQITEYWTGFKSIIDMFSFVVSCRLFSTNELVEIEKHGTVNSEQDEENPRQNHREQKRLVTRALYRIWAEDFLPDMAQQGINKPSTWTRESIRNDALESFAAAGIYE